MDLVYLIVRQLGEMPSPDDCAPLQYAGDTASLEYWRVVPTQDGPYLLEGVIADRAITSVVFAVYGRALARIAERWVVLGRPLDDRWPAFDESDVLRRAAHWIVKMDAREQADRVEWRNEYTPPSFETPASAAPHRLAEKA